NKSPCGIPELIRPDWLRIELRLTAILRLGDFRSRPGNLLGAGEDREIDRERSRFPRSQLRHTAGLALDTAVGGKPCARLQSRHISFFNRRRVLPQGEIRQLIDPETHRYALVAVRVPQHHRRAIVFVSVWDYAVDLFDEPFRRRDVFGE